MKNKYILITFCLIISSCSSSNNLKEVKLQSIQKSILELYFKRHEIDKNQKRMISKNFRNLTKIIPLIEDTKFNYEKGIYKVSLNVTHTTSHLLLISENDFKIVELDNNINLAIEEVRKFLLVVDFPNESSPNNYIEEVISISDDNIKIVESNRIKPLP